MATHLNILAWRITWIKPGGLHSEVEQFYEDIQDLLKLTQKRDIFFIIGDWNAK